MRGVGLFIAAAAGLLPAVSAPAGENVRTIVDERVAEWWPTTEEKKFDQIGWAADLRTARRLSAEHNRPLFLFTMDGRVNTGRC
jgi:hypothetical protein